MATKVQLESKIKALAEAYKLESEQRQKAEADVKRLDGVCEALDSELERVQTQRAEIQSKLQGAEKAASDLLATNRELERLRLEAQDRGTITELNLTNAKLDLDFQTRRANDLERTLKHIARLCAHRSRVSHSVDLFQCDADGNRLIVPEEVRFLREIAEICNDNEIPF